MNLPDLVLRRRPLAPWGEGEKIPWHEPGFSRRMLQEHLSQEHDLASRRFERIDRQVSWIDGEVLARRPSRVLDLACGPGLYSERLSRLGHECFGIDYSPASIAYAKERAERDRLRCSYLEQDIRTASYGTGFDLALLIFGEFNVFPRTDASAILGRARAALSPRGFLLLEAHTLAAVREIGERAPSWYTAASGLFSDRPHLVLRESAWDGDTATATERYFAVDAETGVISRHGATIQAYSDSEYRSLLQQSGFSQIELRPSLGRDPEDADECLLAILARR